MDNDKNWKDGIIVKDIRDKYTTEHEGLVKEANLEIERHRQKIYADSGDRELYR